MTQQAIDALLQKHKEEEPWVLALEKFVSRSPFANNELHEAALKEVFESGKRSASQWILRTPDETIEQDAEYLVTIRFDDGDPWTAIATRIGDTWVMPGLVMLDADIIAYQPKPDPYQPETKGATA